MKKLLICFLVLSSSGLTVFAQPINRKALVQRHVVHVKKIDSLSSLTVGNGKFAFTVDATGLQSFPSTYEKGVSLGTQSEWGWHYFPDTANFRREESLRTYQLNGSARTYLVQMNETERTKAASNWFRQNPHRLQLGQLGFVFLKKDGSRAGVEEIQNIHQVLDPWTGEVKSHFQVEGTDVKVSTFCHDSKDAVSVHIESDLIKERRIMIFLHFPYPTGAWTDEGNHHGFHEKHRSGILYRDSDQATVYHTLDATSYTTGFSWSIPATMKETSPHRFLLTPAGGKKVLECTVQFRPGKTRQAKLEYADVRASSTRSWNSFWNSGGAIDFAGSDDPRAHELERRVILSQYLIRAQEAGHFPPQETGLTYNSWFGKPHLEMHWWHAAHFALWGRPELLEKSMSWYLVVADKARQIAKRQGYEGLRWQKMTDNSGDECPSSVGAFLIWQQPHFIYFAELLYREKKDPALLKKYGDLVFASAEFMASFPFYEKEKDRYILGKGLIPAQERFKAEETFNPGFELVYWKWALNVAQQWRERMKLPRNKKWDEVMEKLSPLPVQDKLYLFTENATDSYTNPEYRTDHPAIFGALGMMPQTGQVDPLIMKNTFDWIDKNWSWNETWGWDFPLTAMTATRLNMPEKAIDALLMPIKTNTYLVNGHNYQDDRLRIYLPGNGGLLAAIAMMVGAYDGAESNMPGIPKDGKWKVRWEGLRKMP
jgi:hypothetical protein